MDGSKLTLEQKKTCFLRCYWKCENVAEIQTQYCKTFQVDLFVRGTINQINLMPVFRTKGNITELCRLRKSTIEF